MKLFSIAFVLVTAAACSTNNQPASSVQSQGAPTIEAVTLDMTLVEQVSAKAMFERVGVTMADNHNTCGNWQATVQHLQGGRALPTWVIIADEVTTSLTPAETHDMEAMFARLGVANTAPEFRIDEKVTLKARVCEGTIKYWNATFLPGGLTQEAQLEPAR